MIMRISRAPALASAIAVVVATAGYALSQGNPLSNGWDLNGASPAAGVLTGPPLPADEPSTQTKVAAAQAETAASADVEGGIPEIAMRLIYGPDFEMDGARPASGGGTAQGVTDPAAEPARTDMAEADSAPVRNIELPRRAAPRPADITIVPYPGMPGDAVADLDVPAVPDPETSPVQTVAVEPDISEQPGEVAAEAAVQDTETASIDSTLVAPIPAPVSRRPAPPPLPAAAPDLEPVFDPVPQQSAGFAEYRSAPPRPDEITSITPLDAVSVDPMVHPEAPGSWPRRLDQVNGRRSVERYVSDRIDPDNVFMSDWVQVETEYGTQIVPR